jgi:hypothetical protein
MMELEQTGGLAASEGAALLLVSHLGWDGAAQGACGLAGVGGRTGRWPGWTRDGTFQAT